MLWLTENFHNYTTFSKFAKTFLIQASVLSIRNKKSDILICLAGQCTSTYRTVQCTLYKYVIFIYYRNGAVIVILTIYVYSLKLYKNRNCENYDNILSYSFLNIYGPVPLQTIPDIGSGRQQRVPNEKRTSQTVRSIQTAGGGGQPPTARRTTSDPSIEPPPPTPGAGGGEGR